MLSRKVLYGMAAGVLLALLPGVAMAQGGAAKPVDPPQQVAQLRQEFEGLSPQQVEAEGYAAEGPCVPSPSGVGAMGIHAINRELFEAQAMQGEMDPANPPVLLLGEDDDVIGLEWEAMDMGQGPMEMFGRTIELQPGHPGMEEPHYMLHIYFKPDGKVLFGTDAQTAFDPEGVCPEMPAGATASPTASASATATASGSASALPESGGAFSLTPLAALALLVVAGTGVLAFRVVRQG